MPKLDNCSKTVMVTVYSYVLKSVVICLLLVSVMCFNYIFIVLQLAVITEERNKLRNLSNLKNGEAGDGSKSGNPIQVAVPHVFVII